MVIFPDNTTQLIHILDIVILNHPSWCLKKMFWFSCDRTLLLIFLKKMLQILGWDIGKKEYYTKLKILLLGLDLQVCGLSLFLLSRSGWSCLGRWYHRFRRESNLDEVKGDCLDGCAVTTPSNWCTNTEEAGNLREQ